ncbi:GNAT family N-acetyltransferase [Ornithinibacillus contaminans]|uniref:GNAT family N-acetyltransferase n=1 Tax=Ornithinibacillus contaminans TaxID=694055 RepID=UPI00064D79F6|nr:GNAT family N-acetyltransferase [Ornithinibacillus contaminans]
MLARKLYPERLILRAFTMEDATRVQELAGGKEVAKTTLGIPHPYSIEAATSWIENHPAMMANGIFPFAIVLKGENSLIGTMALRINQAHNKGELAFWVGKEYWGNGFATEAAREIVRYGFEELKLNKLWAMAMSKYPASSKVMEKVGIKREGVLRQGILMQN